MISKVYVCKNIQDALLEAKVDFIKIQPIFLEEDINLISLAKIHQKNLFQKNNIKVLYDLDIVESELLLKFLDLKIDIDCVWCFSRLAKNTKVFKKLSNITSIEFIEPLETSRERQTYIKKLIDLKKLPKEITTLLVESGPESRSELYNEIDKAEALKNIGKIDIFKNALASYENNKISIDLTTSMLDSNIDKSYIHIKKISEMGLPLEVFYATFMKKLISYYLLNSNNIKQSLDFWRTSDFYIDQERKKAKSLGNIFILELISYISKESANIFQTQDTETGLLKLLYLIFKKSTNTI